MSRNNNHNRKGAAASLNGHETIPRIAAIIPAYNEGGRISKVLLALSQVEHVQEIIVVDDGSNDSTQDEARQAALRDPRVRIVEHPVNQGKGEALFTGWRATRAPYLLFLDADLINLKPQHIRDLMEPVLCRQVEMTLGLFQSGFWRTDLSHWLTPWLTGQRCLRSDLLRHLSQNAAAGYGFETALTLAAHQQGWRCQRVPLVGVSHPPGEIPRGGWHGPRTKIIMYAHIVRAWLRAGQGRLLFRRLGRRVRSVLFLTFAFGFSLANNYAMTAAGIHHTILIKCLNSEIFWLFWRELKVASSLLQ